MRVDRNPGFGTYAFRPDVLPGVRQWLDDPSAPGGRQLNPAAFEVPVERRQGNLGRNTLVGSPLEADDVGLSRWIRVGDRVTVRARLDAFNVFNVPNFGRAYRASHIT